MSLVRIFASLKVIADFWSFTPQCSPNWLQRENFCTNSCSNAKINFPDLGTVQYLLGGTENWASHREMLRSAPPPPLRQLRLSLALSNEALKLFKSFGYDFSNFLYFTITHYYCCFNTLQLKRESIKHLKNFPRC